MDDLLSYQAELRLQNARLVQLLQRQYERMCALNRESIFLDTMLLLLLRIVWPNFPLQRDELPSITPTVPFSVVSNIRIDSEVPQIVPAISATVPGKLGVLPQELRLP